MNTERYIRQPSAWLPRAGLCGVVVSSRIRLARNLKATPFPGWAAEEERERVWHRLRELLADCPTLQTPDAAGMEELEPLDKQVLFERCLISREQAGQGAGSGVAIRPDEAVSVMVNEEDHLRLQSFQPGLALDAVWETVDRLDSEIEAATEYAYSPVLGYLTACPTNVGTGMRASVMLHLPGLVYMKEMNAVVKGMAKIGLAVRGLWGEGSEAAGNMFQVSNQITLGEREADLLQHLEQIVQEIVEHEKNARWRLFEASEELVRDRAGRALGVLSNAHLMASKEALDLLSDLRLGIDMGVVSFKRKELVNDLLLCVQPGHLQAFHGHALAARERDVARAAYVRERIEQAKNNSDKRTS